MEYTNEILIFSLLYIGLINWMYIREYKKNRELGEGERSELLLITAIIVIVWIALTHTI